MKWIQRSIRNKLLVIFFLLLLITASGLGFFAYHQASQTVLQEVETALSLLAEEATKFVEISLEAEINILETMARRPELQAMDWDKQQPVLAHEEESLDFLGLGIVYPDGLTRYPDGDTAQLGDRDYVQRAFAGDSNFSDVIISRVINRPVVMVATPIEHNEEVVGVLIARSDGLALSQVIEELGFGPRGQAFMLNGEGYIIGHADPELVMEQANFLEMARADEELQELGDLAQRMTQGEEGIGSFFYEDHIHFVGFAPITGTDWSIAVGALEEDVLAGTHFMGQMIGLGTIIALILGVIIAYLAGHSITRPLQMVTDYTENMGAGDFTFTIHPRLLKRRDETGSLARAFKTMQTSIISMVQEVSERSDEVLQWAKTMAKTMDIISSGAEDQAGSVEELTATMEEMSSSIQEVASNVQDASNHADTVSHSVLEVNKSINMVARDVETISQESSNIHTSLEEMVQGIQKSAQETLNTEQQVHKAMDITKKGQDQIDQTVEEMEDINTTVQNLSQAMDTLGHSAEKIGDILNVIDDIAEKTNLLALNAAIEAARAGEQGKGFAVVAQSIGDLAQRSQTATRDIQNLITTIQHEVQDAVQMSKTGSSKVQAGTQSVREAGHTFQDIFQAVETVTSSVQAITKNIEQEKQLSLTVQKAVGSIHGLIQEVAQASEQQAQRTHEVANMVEQMATLARNVAAASEEQGASSDEVVKTAENVSEIATSHATASEEMDNASQDLKELATDLSQIVKKFTIR